ncbi:hypothetical protein QQF64_025000 [Cirrhinus molitorella]|uniref:Uncharacterized protein n=1 Tax=Cirrhinus molitorella TaxID=172907 RepID=A0ABR3NMV8_9TELE
MPPAWTPDLSQFCLLVCVRSTEVTSHVKAHRTLHMMRAGRERGQVKEGGCAGAGMYEYTQAESEGEHKGSQQHRAGAQSKHRAGGETATSVTSLHSTQPTTLFSRAQPNIQDV